MKSEQLYVYSDTVISDYNGNYMVIVGGPARLEDFQLKFEDIDGEAHGSYQTKDTIVKFTGPIFEGGEGWSKGEASKELNIKLKKEES